MEDAIKHDLQWPSHVGNAIQRSDILEGSVFVKNLAAPHELVKAQINERTGRFEFAVVHAVGGIATMGWIQ
jgi:hypothetical protein